MSVAWVGRQYRTMSTLDSRDQQRPPGARVVAPFAHTLWEVAVRAGMNEAHCQAVLGRAEVGDQDVPVERYLELLAQATQTLGSEFAWRLGQSVKPTTYGVSGILMMASPNLQSAVQEVLRFEGLAHDLGRTGCQFEDGYGILTWDNWCEGHAMAGAVTEAIFAGAQACSVWLSGRAAAIERIEFRHQRPAGEARIVEDLIGAPVSWGSARNRLYFQASLLERSVPHAVKDMLPMIQHYAESLLKLRHRREADLLVQIRQSIARRLGSGSVKLADIAHDLHLSARTLQRRLEREGVAFQAMLDTSRHDLARHYLATSNMALSEVGHLLGFGDTPAFAHAFRRWQGQSPGQYRISEQHRGNPRKTRP